MRTFIAIELTDAIRQALAALSERLRRANVRASWVAAERVHLTLRFLGEVNPDDVERVSGLLEDGCKTLAPFELHVREVGAFPNLRSPRVIWAGVGPLESGLIRAHGVAEEAARAIGIPPETKPFRPHLTLARVKDRRNANELARYVEREKGFDGGSFSARTVALFSSRLTPRGPVYRRLQEFPFSWTSSSEPFTAC